MPDGLGIRSAKLRLTDREYVEANSPRVTVAPNVLTAALEPAATRRDLSFARRQGFTTWLGLRYDRPAVPEHLVSLAQRIGKEVARPEHRTIAARVRDVLMQFDDADNPVRYSLFAVLDDPADEQDVRAWLARVSQAVPTDLGVANKIEAADASGIAFSTIETSYAADVSLVTWRREQPEPEGTMTVGQIDARRREQAAASARGAEPGPVGRPAGGDVSGGGSNDSVDRRHLRGRETVTIF